MTLIGRLGTSPKSPRFHSISHYCGSVMELGSDVLNLFKLLVLDSPGFTEVSAPLVATAFVYLIGFL